MSVETKGTRQQEEQNCVEVDIESFGLSWKDANRGVQNGFFNV